MGLFSPDYRVNMVGTGRKDVTYFNSAAKIFSLFSPLGATAPISALAYLHETLRFTSVS
jgi:hypothetical protein